MNAHTDPELNSWLLTILNGDPERRIAPAGDFLKSLAHAALRADIDNYAILRPALLKMKRKYKVYADPVDRLKLRYRLDEQS